MKIEILGTGCYNCMTLESLVAEVLKEIGRTDAHIVRVSDEKSIRRVMPPDEIPGLVVDGHLLATRKVPEREELAAWLAEA